jgi:hypothetical protein
MSRACVGPCSVTYVSVKNVATDVTIRSVRRTRLNLATGAPVPGGAENVPTAQLSREVLRWLRRHLGNFVRSAESCAPGCYCDTYGQITTANAVETFTLTHETDEERTTVWLNPPPNAKIQDLVDQVVSGQTTATDVQSGKPYSFDPTTDRAGSTSLNCCGQPTLEIQILNRVSYELQIRARLELLTETGECRSLEGFSGGIVV